MGSLQQALGTFAFMSLSSCSLETLVSNDSQDSTARSGKVESVSEASYSRRAPPCRPPVMSCSLTESTVSNEEYSSATVVCAVPRRSCVTGITYDAGDLGTGSLSGSFGTYTETIDTEAIAAGTYLITLTGSDSRRSTIATLSVDVVDLYGPTAVCTATDGANDGSQDLSIQCTIEDETAMGDVYYFSSFGSDLMSNSGSTYDVSFDVTGLATAEETISIIAFDSEGNPTYVEVTGQIEDVSAPTVTSVYTDVSSVLNDHTESFVVYACF
ncbi:MAG: hypothetical protein AABX98_02710, partial [Nanoarchaeota archaeon]